jgi:hypothetical protein
VRPVVEPVAVIRASRLSLVAAAATLTLAGARQPGDRGQLPLSSLAARIEGKWATFWKSEAVLEARPHRRLLGAVRWQPGQPGTGWAELELAGNGEAWRTRVILLKIDPAHVQLTLANGASPGGYEGTWTVAQAPAHAIVALNAGQFSGGATWGWVVHEGVEYRAPQPGPLATAVVIDRLGQVRFLSDSAIEQVRADTGTPVVEAFQSYPVLVRAGVVPSGLSRPSPFINLTHRDARLALGLMEDGTLLVALTRFDGLGGALGAVPVGLTVPEMSGLMASLGVHEAVALDGGISAQLMLQDASGERMLWKGLRRVPLGLVGTSVSSLDE